MHGGGAGKDTFIYNDIGDGADGIFNFQTGTGADADVIDLAALLSYDPNNSNHDFNDFITLIDNTAAGTSTLKINVDGMGTETNVIINLTVGGLSLTDMISDGNIVLL